MSNTATVSKSPEASRGARWARARRTPYRRDLPASTRRIVPARAARRRTRRLEATTRTPSRREDSASSPTLLVRREARRPPPADAFVGGAPSSRHPNTSSAARSVSSGSSGASCAADHPDAAYAAAIAARAIRRGSTLAAANRPRSRRASGCRAMASTVTVCAGVNPGALRVGDESQRRLFVLGDARARRPPTPRAPPTRTPPEATPPPHADRARGTLRSPPPPPTSPPTSPASWRAGERPAARSAASNTAARREGGTGSAATPRRRSRAHAPSRRRQQRPRLGVRVEVPARARERDAEAHSQGARVRAAGGRLTAANGRRRPASWRRRRISTSVELRRDVRSRGVGGGASRSNRLPHRLVVLLSRRRPAHVASHARASCPGVTRRIRRRIWRASRRDTRGTAPCPPAHETLAMFAPRVANDVAAEFAAPRTPSLASRETGR